MRFPDEFMCGWKVNELDGFVTGVDVITSPSPHRIVAQALGQLAPGLADIFAEHNKIVIRASVGIYNVSRVQLPDPINHLSSDVRNSIAHAALVGAHDLFIVTSYLRQVEKMVRKLVPRYVDKTNLRIENLLTHKPNVEVVTPTSPSAKHYGERNVMHMRPRAHIREHGNSSRLRIWGFHPTFPLSTWAHTLMPTLIATLIIEHVTGTHMVAGSDSIN